MLSCAIKKYPIRGVFYSSTSYSSIYVRFTDSSFTGLNSEDVIVVSSDCIVTMFSWIGVISCFMFAPIVLLRYLSRNLSGRRI